MSEQASEQNNLEAETAEINVSSMTPKERKRYKARLRKRRQRAHEHNGIPSGVEARLRAEWKQNLVATAADPVAAEALEIRLFEFVFLRDQMHAALLRMRGGVHPECEGEGRFYDCIAQHIVEHIARYGLQPLFRPEFIFIMHSNSSEAIKAKVVDALKADPKFLYRATYGLDIDSLSQIEVYEYFEAFISFYLAHRDDVSYGFDWQISDEVLDSFEIPEQYLAGIFARPNSAWIRLHRRRTDSPPTP